MPGTRKYAGPTAMVLIAVMLSVGCGGCTGGIPAQDPSPEESSAVTTALHCGQPFEMPGGDALTLVGRFPAEVTAAARSVTGSVAVSSREPMAGVAAPNADVFLVLDGRIATLPLAQDALGVRWHLTPGNPRRVPGQATLVSCRPDGDRLPSGHYQVYARVVFTSDDGPTVEGFGGPWQLRVR